MSKPFEVIFFDAKGNPFTAEMSEEESAQAEASESEQTATSFEAPERFTASRESGYTTTFKICHINGVPDVKTEIVYRTIKIPFDGKIRVPTVAVRTRSCNTDFVATLTVNEERIVPIIRECAVMGAVEAAPIIIAGCATVVGAPAAIYAGLEAFTRSVAQCLAQKGFDRKVFDVKLEQKKSCTPWH